MDIRKMTCVCVAAAVVAFSAGEVRAGKLTLHDRNGKLIPLPSATEDGQPGEKAEGFKLSLKADAKNYEVNGLVRLSVKFTNIDREDAAVSGLGVTEYKLEVLRPDGTLAPLTYDGKKASRPSMDGGDTGPGSPGMVSRAELTGANLYFDMTQLGHYYLRVLKAVPARTDPSKKVTLISNVITIRIEAPKSEDAAMTTAATQEDDDDATQAATDETAAP